MLDIVQLEIQRQETLASLRRIIAKQDKLVDAARRHNRVAVRMRRAGYETSSLEAQRRARRKLADAGSLRPAIAGLRAILRRA